MKKCGIYQIRNIDNNLVYIGQSSDIVTRRYKHFYDLAKGVHDNSHLQNSYNLNGADKFVFEILVLCEIKDLDHYEQILVNRAGLKTYNIMRDNVKIARGVKRTEETKRKIGLKSLGNKNRLGKIFSLETIEKMRKAKQGKKASEETKKKMSESRKGHPSYSTKLKGIPRSDDVKRKIGEKNKGHIVSDKQRKQISDFWRNRREALLETANEN